MGRGIPFLGGPVERLDLPKSSLRRLRSQGVVTCAQLLEFVEHASPGDIRRLLGMSSDAAKDLFCPDAHRIGSPPALGIPSMESFSCGLAGPLDEAPGALTERRLTAAGRLRLIERALKLEKQKALPSRMLLKDHDPSGVGDQGSRGTCVGWASSSTRELTAGRHLSPLFAYALAKTFDSRPDLEGSWLRFAFQGFHAIGHLLERHYPHRTDFTLPLPVEEHRRKARRFKVRGFSDILLEAGDLRAQPTVLKAILAGKLSRELGPQPVAIGVALHESFFSPTTQATGLVRVPGADEPRVGGHGMCLQGYISSEDPGALYSTTYFIAKNSWGKRFASQNPLGLKGYALIPASYFTRKDLLWEAVISIAEPSPVAAGGRGGLLRLGWENPVGG